MARRASRTSIQTESGVMTQNDSATPQKTSKNEILELPYREDFLLELQNNNYSLETVYNYRRDLNVFEVFMNIRNVDFNRIDKRFITVYKGFLRSPNYIDQVNEYNKEYGLIEKEIKNLKGRDNQTLSSKSVNRMLSALRRYFKYLDEFELVERMPVSAEAIKLIKTEKKKSQVAELDDLIKLMEFPSDFEKNEIVAARNRAILELLFSSGLRISELVNLNRYDLNQEGKIYIQGKGKKQRFIYITPRAMFHINRYLELREAYDNESLFAPTRGGRNGSKNNRISTNYVQERIATYRKVLGIVVPTSAHSFRHGFATYLAEEGASPAAIQILLGHESLHTTDRYVHASDKFAQDAHKRYHPLYNPQSNSN